MWRREVLKEKGKNAFVRNYWRSVLCAFIVVLLTGGSGFRIDLNFDTEAGLTVGNNLIPAVPVELLYTLFGVFLVAGILRIVFSLFVSNPFGVGGCKFFVENSEGRGSLGSLLFAFQGGHYINTVVVLFLKGIYTFLWSLLLIIPGIIKGYEYSMIPYLLADSPGIDAKSAFRISREMTMGHKWNMFVLDLSFLGWQILSMITFGILGIFYVNPYVRATKAELYLELMEEHAAKGI